MQKSESILSHEYFREHLHYSVITGELYWLKSRKRVKIGAAAGTLHHLGYRQIMINQRFYLAHRLAWFWVMGKWPVNQVDHKNGIKHANCWINLREATSSQNNCNKEKPSNNTSGYKGIMWHKQCQKWQARIVLNGKFKHLGLYTTPELAYEARLKAEKELHGDFAKF